MAAAPSRASKISALQKKLNANARSRNAFLKDPGGVLKKEGIELSAARERELKAFIDRQTSIPNGKVDGVTVRSAAALGIGIRVCVGVAIFTS